MKLVIKNGISYFFTINDRRTAKSHKTNISWIWHVFQNIEMRLPEVRDWAFCQQTAKWTHKSEKMIPQRVHAAPVPRNRQVVQEGMLYMVRAQQTKNTILFNDGFDDSKKLMPAAMVFPVHVL